MPKINQEEYEVLKGLDDKWKWIARDEDRGLYAFTEKPVRNYGHSPYWWDKDGWDVEPYSALELVDETHLFLFIQWEDGEPYNIADLIAEYESEETEVKDKAELKSWFGDDQLYSGKYVKHKINQLDEPEVLSQEWVDRHTDKFVGNEWFRFVNTKDLKNLLVPKQEEVDRAYEEGREHGFYKGYREGLGNKGGEPEPKNITLQDVTDKLWELPSNNRKLWLARLNDEFQEGYIVPLGLKTTDGEEQYLTYNGSYFASRRNKHLQQTFDTLEEIPEFYRELAEKVL